MSLTYRYTLSAPAGATAQELKSFLDGVGRRALDLGFARVHVLDVAFDTVERRAFARRLCGSFVVEDERLKGGSLPVDGAVSDHNRTAGACRVNPTQGVVLVLTEPASIETCFGFLKYPETVRGIDGTVLAETDLGGRWFFRDWVNTPDPRFRAIVRMFSEQGFLEDEKDEFAEQGP